MSDDAFDDAALIASPASDLTYFALAATAAKPAVSAPRPALSELPEVLGGRYKIERLLGVGGMGAVYRARDLLREQFGDPDPYVALKTLSDDFAEYPDANALLYSEFALTARLNHPHVVRLFGFEVDVPSQRAFLILELLKGLTLDQLLSERPSGLPWGELQDIAIALLDALSYSHSLGVLHGDLKPSNVMLAEDGLRLFDYGLGQPVEGLLPGLPRLCRNRFTAWTPRYAALELLDGAPLSAAADVYALACVLYELASGRHPFNRLSAKQAKALELDQKLQRPEQLPAHCWPALRRALAFDEAQRTIDCAQLLAVFRQPTPGGWRRWLRRS
ncbi:MAG: serine/threonine protein kinase [Gammaproteobacteria bacterium]|nr:serine/threonine protein kinase [Gammaproteobacteria bacterium]MBU1492121.1 serine/threonine protein kinase [Gammaproteobacteria bacterium]MBU2064915.1 serine/threonine protein kinase [Gammaproteobacteria bacterium]MBU2139245.1 serine/threonine protein kinase [Gammaproteobacteria bacterium]MBU2215183.1 serine/threonine protein kinase [Gammaproteobacteria bacterium]